MFTKKWRWQLPGRKQRIRLNVIGKTGSFVMDAIFDTGADTCVFPLHVFRRIFKGDRAADVEKVRGVGETMAVSRRVSIEILSVDGEIIEKITNVEAAFILDKNFKVSLFGVSNAIDRFKWVLDYPRAEMTAEKP
jgi:hypothetical protein